MRRFVISSLIAASLFFTSAAAAQAQCLLCFGAGFVLGSAGSGQAASGVGGEGVIYQLPRASERVADPLGVKVAAAYLNFGRPDSGAVTANGSLNDLFVWALKQQKQNASTFTVLEIKIVQDPRYLERAAVWFYYIENEKVKPLDSLPPAPSQ